MGELMTIREVAERLGVSVSRARQIARGPGFPEPLDLGTPVHLFRPDEVERFAASYAPRPVGRPPKPTDEECQE